MVYTDEDGGATNKIRIEHFDIDGTRSEARPRPWPRTRAFDMDAPQIAMAANGSYLVTYERETGAGNVDILGTIVNPDGTLGTTEFVIEVTQRKFSRRPWRRCRMETSSSPTRTSGPAKRKRMPSSSGSSHLARRHRGQWHKRGWTPCQ